MMSMAVVVVESAVPTDRLGPWMPDDPRVAVVSTSRISELARWVDHVRADHVLVAGRASNAARTRLAANLVAGARSQVSVATRVLPTTSVGLAASALYAHTLESDPVRLLGAFDQLATQSLSGAVLKSVTKLDHPKPTFGMHLKSLFGRNFVASTTPTAAVTKQFALPANGQPILVAAEPGSADFARAAQLANGHPVEAVPVLANVQQAYRSAGAEFVALSQVALPAAVLGQCPVCRLSVFTDVCPFCHVHHRVSEPA